MSFFVSVAAVGAAVAGSLGVTLAVGGIAATVVGGMVIGAVVGGVTAAVRGGNILKGMAVGGLIGGVVGALGAAAGLSTVAETAAAPAVGATTATAATVEVPGAVTGIGTAGSVVPAELTSAVAPTGGLNLGIGPITAGTAPAGNGLLSSTAGQTLAFGTLSGAGQGYMQGQAAKDVAKRQQESDAAAIAARKVSVERRDPMSSPTYTKTPVADINTPPVAPITPIDTRATVQANAPQAQAQAKQTTLPPMDYRNLTQLQGARI